MKKNKPLFIWGDFDRHTPIHLILGIIIYYIMRYSLHIIDIKTDFDIALEPKWIAWFGISTIAFLWEYSQRWRKGASMSIQDIVITSIPSLIIALFT